MKITPINTITTQTAKTSFKSKTILKPKTVGRMLETTMAAAAVYGIAQINKKEEKSPFIETKNGENIVSIKLNSKGKEEYRIIIKPSKIAGEYDITQTFPNGKKKILSSAKQNKSGVFDIQKDFVSPNGLRTLYKKSGTDDDYQMSYIIKDNNGQVKLNFTRSFKKLDNDTTESIVNGKKHINTFGILGVESINQDNPDDKNFMIVNWRFEDNLKNFPAEIFYCIGKNKIRILEDNYGNENNACVSGHLLKLSTELRNDFFVFAHEVGHIKSDELGDLAKDEELQKIFEQEREEALRNFGKVLQEEADYFLMHPYRLREVIAETYAILSGLSHNDVKSCLGMRTNILMQYFPKTITYIANRFYKE